MQNTKIFWSGISKWTNIQRVLEMTSYFVFFLEGIQKISWSETFFNSFEYDEKMKGIELTWWIASSVIFYTRTQSIKEAESTSFLALNYIYVVIENFSLFLSETNFQLFWFRKNCVEDSRNLRTSTYTMGRVAVLEPDHLQHRIGPWSESYETKFFLKKVQGS